MSYLTWIFVIAGLLSVADEKRYAALHDGMENLLLPTICADHDRLYIWTGNFGAVSCYFFM